MNMQNESTMRVVAKVLGTDIDPDYLLAESDARHQFIVPRRVFHGHWESLKRGDMVELILTSESLARVLGARPFLDASDRSR